MKIILGSSSKYRREVLQNAGFSFEIMSPDIDEKAIRTKDYYELPVLLAQAKREALIPKISEDALVITSDQVVVCNGNLHEKPANPEEAELFLTRYSQGHPGETVSAVVVTNTKNGKHAGGVDIARTYFKHIPLPVMEEFIKYGDPFSKAGGFSIHSGILKEYIDRIDGAEDSIMGMPLALLEQLFNKVKD